ncbi:PD-(D/E)XK nuclease family protein [Methanobrevibacter sp.]|uniref:PD-(D/E)XK nuclease family protein n=1 Tax=Methanobrevibacter sp. TaxID=66852 RepID=UPI00388DD5ED
MEIEFIEELHMYLVDGVITPSVSDILRFIFPNKYSNIPASILNAKAEFGTHIHEAIEKYENCEDVELTPMEEIVFEQYLDLKERFEIEPIEQETLVHFEDRYCGRLDMIANVSGIRSLIDIKTTAKLDKESLSWQLSFYSMAYLTKNPKGYFDKYYCLWLPKGDLGQLVEITPKPINELLEVLERYEKQEN